MADTLALIDSASGQCFTRKRLAEAVAIWSAAIKAGLGKKHFAPQAYAIVALEKSAASVLACLVTEALECAFVMSDFSDMVSICERVRPLFAFVPKGYEADAEQQGLDKIACHKVVIDVETCCVCDIVIHGGEAAATVFLDNDTEKDVPAEIAKKYEGTNVLFVDRYEDADTRYITFSSGSTGRPKGIFGSKRCVTQMNRDRQQVAPYDDNLKRSVWIQRQPPAASANDTSAAASSSSSAAAGVVDRWRYAGESKPESAGEAELVELRWSVAVNIFLLWECFRPIDFNGTCVVVRQDDFIDPGRTASIIDRFQINELLLTSSFARLYLANRAHLGTAPACVKRVWQNGEPVTEALREAFIAYFGNHCDLRNLYSISECYEVGIGSLRESNTRLRPFPNARIAIDPENGEVVAHTPTIFRGYHKPEGDEMRAFAKDFAWYRTGDRGRILARGGKAVNANDDAATTTPNPLASPEAGDVEFELYGRCTNFVRVKGRFVNLEQIQDVVERGLSLANGVATIRLDAETQELTAYIDGRYSADDLQRVRELCSFPEWMPDRFQPNSPQVRSPASSGKASSFLNCPAVREPKEVLRLVLYKFTGIDVLTLDRAMTLRDLGITSLSVLRLREALLAEAGLDVPVGDLYRISDVRQFASEIVTPEFLKSEVEGICKRVLATAGTAASSSSPSTSSSPPAPTGYFITGSTGYLGGFVMDNLAARGVDAPVFLLVRRPEAETRAIYERKRLRVPRNAVIVKGDVSLPSLGMDEATLARVLRETRYYLHCAAHVVFGCSYAESKPGTVLGAENMLSVYTQSPPAAELGFISTNGVYPPFFTAATKKPCRQSQADFPDYVGRLKEGYGWSKWVAESAALRVCQEVPRRINIFRPGNIGWAESDGRYNGNDFQTLMLFAFEALALRPDQPTWNFEMTPVDVLANFIVSTTTAAASSAPLAEEATFAIHNCIGQRLAVDKYTGEVGKAVGVVPLCEWNDAARAFLKDEARGDRISREAVEQTLASFEEFVTLDMYLSDTNDYFTENNLCYQPQASYIGSVMKERRQMA